MFSGNWKESTEPFVSIDIPDPNITMEGKPSFVTALSYCGECNPRNKTGEAWSFASKAGQSQLLNSFQEDITNMTYEYHAFHR